MPLYSFLAVLIFSFMSQISAAASKPLCENLNNPVMPGPSSFFDRGPAQANMCVVHVNYDCSDKKNDSCLDKTYCQQVKNWCFKYTKQSVGKFDSEQQIRKEFKEHPSYFAKNTNLENFVNDWKRCKSGVYARAYGNVDAAKPEVSKNGGGSGGVQGGNGTGGNGTAKYSGGLGTGEGY